MLNKILAVCLLIMMVNNGCKTTQNSAVNKTTEKEVQNIPVPEPYRASNPIVSDLMHTKLDVRFDWTKRYLFGKATLTLQPHCYPVQSLVLNARGMTINEVSMQEDSIRNPLIYIYQNDSLIIDLGKTLGAGETYEVLIDYVAKPDEVKNLGGSKAIRSDKGLYFINPDAKQASKPQQIWTQGETQSSSVWFPTIDAPNQKMTQEINITVDTAFVTLSNGLMIKSIDNGNGTRTDSWKQSYPHSPYLVMMAIGKFEIVKDQWRDKEVSYYVEPEYKNVARKIFGNTPEMIAFFSKKLGVDFAWEKYAQVVVRDYVSGAMENTSATLFGEFMHNDERGLLDYNGEDVISHELFHQWFGDLVTAESWSNLSLNESFASYGEYLWNEYKYGRDEADAGLNSDLNSYLREAKTKQVNLIRFKYQAQEDLFDRHSYQKGACILHMLRKSVGDYAFFASLKLYLEQNRFQPAEFHQLRLAFEKVTGEDLNWFFNQWYLDKGHPVLDINYSWDDVRKEQHVIIEQKQDFATTRLFKLPMQIDIYANGKATRQKITLDSARQEFVFYLATKPDLINVDAEKITVCTKTDHHTNEEWIYQYHHAPLFVDRLEALQAIAKKYATNSPEAKVIMEALSDAQADIRKLAIKNTGLIATSADSNALKSKLTTITQFDKKAYVREQALVLSNDYYRDETELLLLKSAIKDSSYSVSGKALTLLTERDTMEGLRLAHELQKENNKYTSDVLEEIYSKHGDDTDAAFMQKALESASGYGQYESVQLHGKFVLRCKNENNIKTGLDKINDVGKNAEAGYIRYAAMQVLAELSKRFDEMKGEDKPMYESMKLKADNLLVDLKKNEKNENIRKIIDKQ